MPAEVANSQDAREQLKQVKSDKKQFAKEQKDLKKEAKRKAKELEAQERELDDQIEGNGVPVAIVTLFIIIIWLGIIVLLVKMDVGGIGTNILSPIFKDVPVINMILPSDGTTETTDSSAYGGYNSIKDAVEQIKTLELELEKKQNDIETYEEQLDVLKTEVERLKTFEDSQLEFQQIKEQFYEEVVYAENGPGEDAYRAYFEEMDPDTAQALYKQVVADEVVDKEMEDYISTFSNMDASSAAAVLETMTDDLELVAEILEGMSSASRASILSEMDASIAARIVKIMAP